MEFFDNVPEILTTVTAIFGLLGAYFVWRSETRRRLIVQLEDEIADLKTAIQRTTGQVDPESDLKLIRTAKRSVQVLGTNSLRVLHHSREGILAFLKQGRRFQILLLDPRTPNFRRRVDQEEDHVGRIVAEWRASARILIGIDEKRGGKGQIEVRLYDESPDRSLVIVDTVDAPSADTSMLINYYPKKAGARGYEGAQFLAQQRVPRDRDSVDKNWRHFAELWARSETISIEKLGDIQD